MDKPESTGGEVRLSDQLDRWRPIETAPRDEGKHVLLFGDGPAVEECAYVGYFTNIRGNEEWKEIMGAHVMRPTHWMPLPKPPAV